MQILKKTALERLLVTERHRRQASQSTLAGFAVPAISERALELGLEPLAATDARGGLVETRISRERGVARYGFFECVTEDEDLLLHRFFVALWKMSEERGWHNRCTNLSEVSAKMTLEPRSIVVPYDLVEKVSSLTREESDRLMGVQGYISSGEQQILAADLPDGCALVAAAPTFVGFYTRIDINLGVLLTRVDQAIFLVRGQAL